MQITCMKYYNYYVCWDVGMNVHSDGMQTYEAAKWFKSQAVVWKQLKDKWQESGSHNQHSHHFQMQQATTKAKQIYSCKHIVGSKNAHQGCTLLDGKSDSV